MPGAAIGQLLGGVVLRRWHLKVAATIRFVTIVIIIALLTKAAFFISCDEENLVGWNVPYANSTETGNLISSCNTDCHCDTGVYKQMCGENGWRYFSPCLAGCSIKENNKAYSDCQCISNISSIATSVSAENCSEADCGKPLILFLVIIFIGALLTSCSSVPVLMAVLRCTDDSERTLALGVLNFLGRLFGTIPGPIIYGAAIDSTCGIWGRSCGIQTSCWVYNTSKMGHYLAILGFAFAGLSILFYFLAYKLYKPPREKDISINVDGSTALSPTTENIDTKL